MTIQTGQITAEDLELMSQRDMHIELVRGAIVKMAPAGFE
jgi:hypothetical protein